jgi:hypothetical protein
MKKKQYGNVDNDFKALGKNEIRTRLGNNKLACLKTGPSIANMILSSVFQ